MQIFPFIEAEFENIRLIEEEEKTGKPTAVCTLRLWKKLRVIILQDAAELFIRFPARKAHPMFRLPVFCCPEFEVSVFCCCLCPLRLIVVSNALPSDFCRDDEGEAGNARGCCGQDFGSNSTGDTAAV